MITTMVDKSLKLTTHRCQGKVAAAEIEKVIGDFYQREPTLHVLWDFSAADLSRVTIGEIEQLAKAVNTIAHSRLGGKSAIVSPQDISFGLSRVYQAFAETGGSSTAETRVFRSEQEALEWMK